ncbi:hypothetical protein D3C77_491970 [compost metagenome]
MIAVAQQADAVGAGHTGTGAAHCLLHHPAANALAVLWLGWRVGLCNQYIAIGQHIEPARMVQAFGKGRHLRARCAGRLRALGPADRRRHVDRGDQGFVRLGQLRRRAEPVTDVQPGGLAAAAQRGSHRQQPCNPGRGHIVCLES